MDISLAERVALQKGKIAKLVDCLETARTNQGITDGFLIWLGMELNKIQNSLDGIGYSIKRVEKENKWVFEACDEMKCDE